MARRIPLFVYGGHEILPLSPMTARGRIAGAFGFWASFVALSSAATLVQADDAERAPVPYPLRLVERPLVLPHGLVRASAVTQSFNVLGHDESFVTSTGALAAGLGSLVEVRVATSTQWRPHDGWLGFISPTLLASVLDTDAIDIALGIGVAIDGRRDIGGARIPVLRLEAPVRWRWRDDLACQTGDRLAIHQRDASTTAIGIGIFCTYSAPMRPHWLSSSMSMGAKLTEIVFDESGIRQENNGEVFVSATLHPVWWFDLSLFYSNVQAGLSLSVRSFAF